MVPPVNLQKEFRFYVTSIEFYVCLSWPICHIHCHEGQLNLLGQAHVLVQERLQHHGPGQVQVHQIKGLIHPKSKCSWIRSVSFNSKFKEWVKATILAILVPILTNFSLMIKGFYWSQMCPIQWRHVMLSSSCLKGGPIILYFHGKNDFNIS